MSILSKAKWVTVRRGVSSLLVALLIITQLSGIYFTPRASEAEGNGGSSEVNILKTVSGVAINDWSVENQQRLDAKDDLLFKLYEVGFDGNGKMIPVGDPIGSTKLDANGHIVFVNCLPSQWYAIVEVLENSAEAMFYQADPVYVYLGENGVMSSLKQANAQKDFTVQWSGNYAKGLKLVFSNGEFHVGSKPDGSGQNFTTERFDALMPDGSWIATYCADLGAHNIYGNYRFDENNHGFDEHEMLYLIAAFDFINDNVGGWYYTEELAGLQTVNGKAIAQIVLWNLILEVDTDDHGGYAKNWYEMIHPGANNGLSDDKKVKVAKIEGTDEWYLSMGEPTHEGGLREGLLFLGDVVTNDYTRAKDAEIKSIRELVDDILQNPKAYVALYKDKLDHPASGQEFVAGAAFIKGDDARYDPIDQQRQMLVLFGTAVVFDNRVKPSTDPIAIPIAKKTIGSTDSQDLFTFDAVQVTAIGSEIPVPEGRKGQATIKGEGSGAIEIGSLTPGVYFFMISEDKDATNHDEQWLYDDHCYWVQITVTDNLNNTATAAITGERGSPDFENYKQYVPGVTSVLIEGSKTVVIEGGSIYAGPPRTFAFSAVEVVEIGSEELITGGRSGTATVDSGEFAIGINALTDGIYYFMISEEAGPVGEGWEYADPWWIEVTVTDQGDSTATAIISRVVALADLEDESPPVRTKPEFVNTYTPETVDIEIRGTKTVESDDAYSEQEFTFSAVEVDAMGSHSEVISGFTGDDKIKIIGNGTFCIEITDLPPGVYYFRVSEVIDVAEKKAYWEYDDHAFWVEVVVTDDGKGNAEATLSRSGSADYVNFYEIPLTSITLTGTKEITGDFQGHFPRPFSFTAIEVDNMRSNNAVAAGRTGSVSIRAGEASIPFAITIDGLTVGAHIEPGDPNHDPNHDTYEDAVYYFRIEEDAYSGEGWLYNKDQSVYWIKVIVSFAFDDVSNQWLTKADIIAICDSSTVSTSLAEMPLIFTNHYEIEPASITLSGSKLITGKPSGDLPQFTFDLVQVNAMGSKTEIPDGISLFGQPLDETGRYNFSIADLGLGVYRFMITENIPETTPAYWTYDSHAYWVQVSVTDDGKGQAVATITSERDSRNFTNNYQYVPGVTSVVIPVSKQIEGVYAGEEPRFDFTAVQVASLNSNSLVPGGKSGTGFVTGSGEAFLTISGLTEGTYIFKINEVFTSSPKDGWTYDSHSYWIEIIVSDSGESTAIATPGRISGDKLFTNKYVSKSTAPVSFSGHKFIAFDFVASYPKETFTFDAVQVDGLPTLSRPIPGEIGVISADYQVAVSNVGDEYPGEYSYSITIPAGLETGDYYFRLSERIPAQVGNWKYDSHVYYIKIAVTDIEGKGEAKAEVVETWVPNFTNGYTGNTAGVKIPINKQISGNYPGAALTYTFNATQVRAMGGDVVVPSGIRSSTVITGAGSGEIDLAGLFLNSASPCHYYFRISETASNSNGWTYDRTAYWIEVTLEDEVGLVSAEITSVWYSNGAVYNGSGRPLADAWPLRFSNSYSPEAAAATLKGNKVIQGEYSGTPLTFTFNAVQVTALNSTNEVPAGLSGSASVNGEGSFSIIINNLKQSSSPYFFLITENSGSERGWSYDTHQYWLRVDVSDNGAGFAVATISEESGSATFTNSYQPPVNPYNPPPGATTTTDPITTPSSTPSTPGNEDEDTEQASEPGSQPTSNGGEDEESEQTTERTTEPSSERLTEAETPSDIVFEEGSTPQSNTSIDLDAKQDDPDTPGGRNPMAPPVPSLATSTLTPMIDGEFIFFMEFGEDGVPLGQWHWQDDDDGGMWFFDEFIPLAGLTPPDRELPSTGQMPVMHMMFILWGMLLLLAGVALEYHGRLRFRGR